jgi:hypothetical protein
VFAPIAALSGNGVLADNVVLLAVLTLNGYGACRLCRRFVVDDRAAIAGGALGGALPFVLSQLGVIQLTVVFPLFLLIEWLVAWAASGRRRDAVAMGVWLATTFLTCGYYGLFAVVVVGLAGLVLVRRRWFTGRRALDVVAGAATFAVLALPVAAMQARLTAGYERTAETIAALSATREDLLRLFPATYDRLETAMRDDPFPGPASTGLLWDAGVSFVVATHEWLTHQPSGALSTGSGFAPAFRGAEADVYQLLR